VLLGTRGITTLIPDIIKVNSCFCEERMVAR